MGARHGAIEVMQLERPHAVDGVDVQPGVAGAVGAGHHQPVQHAGKHRALQREAELASGGEALDHRRTAGLLAQAAEDQRSADARGGRGLQRAVLQAGDQQGGLGEPGAGLQQGLELASGLEVADTAERGQHALARGGTVTGVLHQLQVATRSGWLDAEEHAAPRIGTAWIARNLGKLRKRQCIAWSQLCDVAPHFRTCATPIRHRPPLTH